MAGLHIDISTDPYPDSFTLNGPNAVAIFTNDAPNTDNSGLRIAKNGYLAIYLAWNFQYTGTTNADKDAVLSRAMNWLAPAATWVQPVPSSGTVADHAQQAVAVTLNAGDPAITQPGTYLADLKMSNNTPGMGTISIPVTMTVNAPATWGKLAGTVTGLGYCDSDPAPIAGATVTVETSNDVIRDLTTDNLGHYQVWMEAAVNSPITITVDAEEHISGSVTGVSLIAGQTVTRDFSLRWLVPCTGANPTALEVTLEAGQSLTEVLQLNNTGAYSTTFKISERPGGFTAPAGTSELNGNLLKHCLQMNPAR